ncbi:hypothetical protein A2872_01170 [Candidatus Gottesmanbacteria bacterium RIFCSPHIGHO2_01_FULL_42_12]|uniref:Pyridoxamine 5'-phosphate oxidase N-terminal domain-containing protein n=1 Tax=Candidatus Gottesmanbacteria bacterium RIFCSPHIGHO2_01_FULL_42_12 TaxID=1798377 RepID=A0A1F5Z2H9_9BACT|nr:MAG: hypothetical protein A2872_01170 [Candidatus Gottesmanbacteria bacterium RIFCSPHIGHO2_01_FULL_42_12]
MQSNLTCDLVLKFLKTNKLMAVATFGKFPWIASVYYTYDRDLNLYFLSDPTTVHAQQIINNPKVAVSICNSLQDINKPKRRLQLWGIAEQISGLDKVKLALKLWKDNLGIINPKLTYKSVKSSMFKITPKRVKLFDQELFKVEDGKEPILEL